MKSKIHEDHSRKNKILSKKLIILLCLITSWWTQAQISIVEDFENAGTPAGWTYSGFARTTVDKCQGAASIRKNLYDTQTTASVTTAAGNTVSNGYQVNVNFDYRSTEFTAGSGAVNNTLLVQYQVNGSGSFITFDTVTLNSPQACFTRNAIIPAGTIPVGAALRIRIVANWISGDSFIYIDNLIVEQNNCPERSFYPLANITPETAEIIINGAINPTISFEYYLSTFNIQPSQSAYGVLFTPVLNPLDGLYHHTISGLIPGTQYYLCQRSKCSETNRSSWSILISFTTTTYTLIPDVNFENKLIALGIDSGATDGKVLTSSINTLTTLNVSNSNISDLTGIQGFVALENLYCDNNLLSSIDLTSNSNLKTIHFYNNLLTNVNINGLVNLRQVFLELNNISSIDISTNQGLRTLDLSGNNFSTFDIPNLPELYSLLLDENNLTSLTFASVLNSFRYLTIRNNFLSSIDFNKIPNLRSLFIGNNNFTNLDLSSFSFLEQLYCNNNLLTSLNLKNGNNVNFSVYNDFSNNPNLSCITVDNVAYSNTNWAGFKDTLTSYSLDCSNTCSEPINLNISNVTSIAGTISWTAPSTAPANGYSVYLSDTNVAPLASINDSNVALAGQTSYLIDDQNPNYTQYVWVRSLCSATNKSAWAGPISFTTLAQQTSIPDINFENKLIALGIDSGTPDGKVLTSNINTLTTLNVANSNINDLTGIQDFIALTSLNCSANNLTTLNITTIPNLIVLNCNNNQLTTINVASNFYLTQLYCNYNNLTAINVSNLPLLTKLGVSYNQLTSINVANNLSLIELACSYNQIASLNLAINTNLIALYCNNNSLTTLNVKNGNNTNFTVGSSFLNNSNLTCITVDNVAYSNTNWAGFKDATANYSINCNALVCNVPTTVTSSAIAQITANISWTAASPAPANGYEFYRSTSATTPTAATTPTGATAAGVLTASLTGLTANTTYYVWVRSVCSATSKSDWSSVIDFTTVSCEPVTNMSSQNIASSITTVSWTSPANLPINGYDYYYGLSSTTNPPNASTLPSGSLPNLATSVTLNDVSGYTTFYIRSKCDGSVSTWVSMQFIADFCRSETISNVTNITNSSANIVVTGASTTGDKYDVFYSTNNNSPTSSTLPTISNLSGYISVYLNNLNENNSYYVWIRRNCGASLVSTWSTFKTFTTLISPYRVTNLAASNLTSNSATISWTAPSYYTNLNQTPLPTYEYYLSTNSAFPTNSTGSYSYTTISDVLNNLIPDTTYYFWIKPYIGGLLIYGPLESLTFTTLPAPVVCNVPTALTSSAIVQTSATISWSAASAVPANGYEYYRSTSATAPTAATTPTGVTAAGVLTASLTGLTANTTYYVWVRSVCSATSTSAWSAVNSFTTLAVPVVCNVPTGLLSALIAQTTATIGWTAPSPIPTNGYAYYVSPLATAPTLTTTPTGTVASSGNAANLSGLTANTQYYFWVQSICSATSSSAWSAVSTFTTLAPPAPCNFPTNIAIITITQTTALLSWNAAVPAPALGFGYDYYISISNTSPTATTMATAGANGITSLTLNNLVANTTYYLWMRTNCSATSSSVWSAINTFTTLAVPVVCNVPTVLTASAIAQTTATISWTAASPAPANGYEYYISTSSTTPALSAVANGSTTSGIVTKNLTGLLAGTSYWVWVRSVCTNTDKSDWSSTYNLLTLTASNPCQVVATNSIMASSITSTSATITWQAPTNAPQNGYDLHLSTNNIVPNATQSTAFFTETGSDITINFNNLLNSTIYYVWIRSNCDSTNVAPWSGSYSFTTASLSNSVFDSSNFTFYPNPVSDELTIKLNQKIDKIEIVNLLGQKIFEKTNIVSPLEIDFSDFASGNYLLKINVENELKVIKILKK